MKNTVQSLTARPTEVPFAFSWRACFVSALTFCPILFYVSQIGRWSLDLDEFYTLRDSSESIRAILKYDKPIYYLLCHMALKTPLTTEVAIRLPGAIAAGLIAPLFYWLGRRGTHPQEAVITSFLVATHPWIFQHSLFGRFYGTMLLFASIAVLSLYRWLGDRRYRWIVTFGVASVLAILTHATAAALLPGAVVGVLGFFWIENREEASAFLRRHLRVGGFFAAVLIAIAALVVHKPFVDWLSAQHGQYGNYTIATLILGFVAFCGLQLWALGMLPLFKRRIQWSGDDAFLVGMFVAMTVPFLVLAQFGGGVAPRYLMASVPLLFLLAGRHWAMVHSQLPSARYQIAFAAAVMAASVPTFASTLKDGNHCDYRAAAKYVDSLNLDDAIVVASAHQLLGYYLNDAYDLRELRMLDDLHQPPRDGASGTAGVLYAVVQEAESAQRPLILVSREDRRIRPPKVQKWFNERFAMLARFEQPRFDHRRNEMVVYEYRPR